MLLLVVWATFRLVGMLGGVVSGVLGGVGGVEEVPSQMAETQLGLSMKGFLFP